jgi:fibronectin-binding autotransporter adhesin
MRPIRKFKVSMAAAAAFGSANALAAGSVVFDNTLPNQPHGTTTTVPLVSGSYTINAANTGYLSGTNLFESFATFIVAGGETANFTNSTHLSISNVISRVTGIGAPNGLQPTTINGNLVSTIAGANFWFINPAGVTIGAGATINVPAGLAIGSADYIQFADSSRWYALESSAPTPSVLSTASPTAFGFLPATTAGALSVQAASLNPGAGGSLTLASGGALTLGSTTTPISISTSQNGDVTIQSQSSVALTDATIATGGTITVAGGAAGVALTGSALTTTNASGTVGSASVTGVSISSAGGAVDLTSSSVTTNNLLEQEGSPTSSAAASIVITGETIGIHGGSLESQTLNGADAGNITLTAAGNAANAIQIDGGATLVSNANEGNTSISPGATTLSIANAGTISLQAPAGGIVVSGAGLSTQAGDQNPSGAGAHAGQAGSISLAGSQITLSGAALSTLASPPSATGVQESPSGVVSSAALAPADISLTASGPIAVNGTTTLSTGTSGAVAAGNVTLSGGSVAIANSRVSASNSLFEGGGPEEPVQSTGNAGSITVSSSGTLSIEASTLQSTTSTIGNGGNVNITGNGSQGPTQAVLIEGGSITTGLAPAPGLLPGNAGSIAITGPSVLISGASVNASTVGTGTAGDVTITATGTAGVGPSQGGTGDALLITGGATISATTPSYNADVGALAGSVTIDASAGSLRIDSASTVATNATNNQAGPITLIGSTGLTVDNASILSTSIHGGSGGVGNAPVSVALQSSGPITLSDGATVGTSTSGPPPGNNIVITTPAAVSLSGGSSLTSITEGLESGPGGNIRVTGGSIHVTGGAINVSTAGTATAGNVSLDASGADSGGVPALLIDGGAVLSSDATNGAFTPTASSGSVSLSAGKGTVSIVGTPGSTASSTTVSSSTVSDDGGSSGAVTLTGVNVSLNGATIDTTTAAENSLIAPPASVTVSASGRVSLLNSLIDARTSGFIDAGSIAITGGSVSISGGLQPAAFGSATLPANTALFSGSSAEGNGGSILVSSPNGLVSIHDATLSTASNYVGYGGTIAVVGSGVLIAQQSLLTANTDPGPGAPGSVTVRATGTTAANDPLQNELTSATPGVVRIVDSGVTAVNVGGLNGGAAGRGQISIGADLPGGSPVISNNVVIAGSVLSNDVSNDGTGNNLNVMASKGVWIGPSMSGGYADPNADAAYPDPRFAATPAVQVTGNSRSLISAQTESSAVSGGQILIQGGSGGVTIVSSNVDANNSVDGSNAGSTRLESNITINTGSASGPVSLADSVVTTETSGVNPAGNILISGGSVAVSGGELSAASTANGALTSELYAADDVGNAGSVSVTATQASGAGGAAALTVSGGALIQSSAATAAALVDSSGHPILASDGSLAIPNAGTVTLSATQGSIGIASGSTLTTAAGPNAGNAGVITLSAPHGGVTVANSAVNTDAASTWTVDSNGNAVPSSVATIAIGAAGGAVSLNDAVLTANTSGTIAAGDINVQSAAVDVSGGSLTAKTTGTGSAGNIALAASAADANGAPALQVSGGAQLSSDASGGLSAATNAGTVTLSAVNGTVQVGLSADSAQTNISSSAGAAAGAAGAVTIRGAGINLGNALVATTAAGSTPSITRGTIVLDANGGAGPLTVANSTLNATTSGAQQAGEIELQGDPIVISNSTISSKTTGTGAAGSICVGSTGGAACVPAPATAAQRPIIRAGAASTGSIAITASTLSTSTSTSGNAGNIDVTSTGALALSEATIESKSTSPSPTNAGTVGIIKLSGAPVSITNHSLVSATSVGTFVPGETTGAGTTPGTAITISSTGGTAPLQVSDSSVNASAGLANGSNIVIDAGGSPIELQRSTILASANAGNGGNITINDAGTTTLQQTGILARATAGNGGAINIQLKGGAVFVQDAQSLVSATSQTGNNGTVTISGPQTNFQSSLFIPEVSAAKSPELSANACQRDGSHSTFVREGRGGVAPGPDDYLTGPAADAAAAESAAQSSATALGSVAIAPARLADCL